MKTSAFSESCVSKVGRYVPPHRRKFCRYEIRGGCTKKGKGCGFVHDLASTLPCPYLEDGGCRFGTSCLYFHGVNEAMILSKMEEMKEKFMAELLSMKNDIIGSINSILPVAGLTQKGAVQSRSAEETEEVKAAVPSTVVGELTPGEPFEIETSANGPSPQSTSGEIVLDPNSGVVVSCSTKKNCDRFHCPKCEEPLLDRDCRYYQRHWRKPYICFFCRAFINQNNWAFQSHCGLFFCWLCREPPQFLQDM
mmetsp:Transcript_32082/g.41115  ORF Transcript_32082/g.41115 Transcript_32082/m.41115 type:complete len:251 (+) Transcript_32082:121-873(+)